VIGSTINFGYNPNNSIDTSLNITIGAGGQFQTKTTDISSGVIFAPYIRNITGSIYSPLVRPELPLWGKSAVLKLPYRVPDTETITVSFISPSAFSYLFYLSDASGNPRYGTSSGAPFTGYDLCNNIINQPNKIVNVKLPFTFLDSSFVISVFTPNANYNAQAGGFNIIYNIVRFFINFKNIYKISVLHFNIFQNNIGNMVV
jgi:hypothetical protein